MPGCFRLAATPADAALAFCPLEGGSDEFFWRLRRLAAAALKLRNSRQQRADLLEELIDPCVERIVLPGQLVDPPSNCLAAHVVAVSHSALSLVM
jgi:hypothetical protein